VGDDYISLAARVFSLYEQRRFDEALRVADDVRTRFPDRADRAYYWTACLCCVSGDPDSGLRALQDGLRAGLWYGWSDRAITERDLGEVYRRLRSERDLNEMPIVLEGFSQGAGVAVTLAIDGTAFPVHGFVAVAPGFGGIGHPRTDASEAARRGVRGVLIVGEHDPYRREEEEVQRGLAASGVACDLVVEPGIAHVIPPGFESRLENGARRHPRAKPSDVAS